MSHFKPVFFNVLQPPWLLKGEIKGVLNTLEEQKNTSKLHLTLLMKRAAHARVVEP